MNTLLYSAVQKKKGKQDSKAYFSPMVTSKKLHAGYKYP